MGLREYAAMCRFWLDHPPVALMVAAYFGIKPKPKASRNSEADLLEMMAMMGVSPGDIR
jgi:hypothetical protein